MEACLNVVCQAAKHCGQYQKENGHAEGNEIKQYHKEILYLLSIK